MFRERERDRDRYHTKQPNLEVFFVVVVDNSQKDRHEDVGVDEDVHDKEDGKEEARVVCWHPAKN